VARANGEAKRFTLVLNEYQQAPEITRKRLYLETMEAVFGRTSKVFLDAESSGNVLYLPLDQLGAGTGSSAGRKNMPPIVTPDAGSLTGDDSQAGRNARREGRQ